MNSLSFQTQPGLAAAQPVLRNSEEQSIRSNYDWEWHSELAPLVMVLASWNLVIVATPDFLEVVDGWIVAAGTILAD